MARLLFEKVGSSIWISHLDLMRLFQRAFQRAGLPLKHTQGFNPRPSVSIALPLSVGIQSKCELLDFELENDSISNNEIRSRLNCTLIEGIRVLDVYEKGRNLRELTYLFCTVDLEYDRGVAMDGVSQIKDLFSKDGVTVVKKSKNGPVEQNIIPMLKEIAVSVTDAHTIQLKALICCQNPSLNPALLVSAIVKYLPHRKPDHAVCSRWELYDANQNVFR